MKTLFRLAIAVVVACGVAIVVTTRSSYGSLLASRAAYYGAYRFADVFAHLTLAPDAVREPLAAVPGVAEVDTRVVTEVTLRVRALPETRHYEGWMVPSWEAGLLAMRGLIQEGPHPDDRPR